MHHDWRHLIAAGDLDGLVVATPPETHAAICLAAIDARLPFFVEKPLTIDPNEANEVAAAAERAGVLMLVDHIHLFHESYELLKAETAGGSEIQAVHSRGGNQGPFRPISPLYDWGAHDMALLIDLCGTEYRLEDARKVAQRHTDQGEAANYEVALSFAGGQKGFASFGNLFEHKERFLEVKCVQGTYLMDDLASAPLVFRADEVTTVLAANRSQPLRRALELFVSGIKGADDRRFGGHLGAHVVNLLAAIDEKVRDNAVAMRI